MSGAHAPPLTFLYVANNVSRGDDDGGGALVMEEFNDRAQLLLLKL